MSGEVFDDVVDSLHDRRLAALDGTPLQQLAGQEPAQHVVGLT
jgi:hypothetical protein